MDEFQKEREEWFEKMERLKITQEDYHNLEWELRKRNEDIIDLQKVLSDSQVALFEEREQMLRLKREIADLKQQSVEDRHKILQLVTLGAKEDENRYYFKESKPGIVCKNKL